MADRNFTLLELHVENPKLDLQPKMPSMSLFGSSGKSSGQQSSKSSGQQSSQSSSGKQSSKSSSQGSQQSGGSSSGRSTTMRVVMALVVLAAIGMAVKKMRGGSKQTEIDEYEPVDTEFETADYEA